MLTLSPRKNSVILKHFNPLDYSLEQVEVKDRSGNIIRAEGIETASGLFLSVNKDEKINDKNRTTEEGIIFAIGPEVEGLETGYRVIFNKHSARPFEFEGQEFLTLNANEIFAVVTKE